MKGCLAMDYDYDIKDYSPWIRVDDVNFEELDYDKFKRTFKKNEIIYLQGSVVDYVYIMMEGRVRIFVTSKDGSEQCLCIVERGVLFGDLAAIDGLPNYAGAICVVDSNVLRVPKEIFLSDLFANPSLNRLVLNSFAKKVRVLSNNLTNLNFADASSRVKSYLLKFAFAHGEFLDNKCCLREKFTHQEMANLTGLSRVAVSNVMSEMLSKNILEKKDGLIVINDIHKLYT